MNNDKLINDKWQMASSARFSLTVEMVLWILVVVVALVLRLGHLDAAPLSAPEAREAMLAWRSVTGQGMPEADYSPLLFAANALLFALCGAGDGLARLWPALFGSLLALTPVLLRRRLGRVGALAAGLYLALSPTALFASRQLDGAVVAAVGGMAFLGGLACFFDTGRSAWLTLSSVGLALAVTSSPLAYGLLLALGLAWLGLAQVWPRESSEGDSLSSSFSLTPYASRIIPVFLLAALLFSTGLGWNLGGLGAMGDLLSAWIARLGPVSNPAVPVSPLTLVAVYELLALLFGLGGLVWGVRRRHRFGVLLGLWAGLGILLLALMPGRAVLDVLWVVLPLALLTGVALEQLVRSLRERGEWLSEGLYVPLVVILLVHSYLVLARYAVSGVYMDLALALLALGLQVLLALIFALAMGFDSALRAIAVGLVCVLVVVTLSAGWGVAQVRPADPRELLVREPTAVEVRDLVQTLRDISWRETGIATRLPFVLEATPDSVLAWYLRDFSAARRVENLDAGVETSRVLVTAQRDLTLTGVPDDVSDGTEYVGQDFATRRSWDTFDVGCTWEWPPRCQTAIEWLLFRRARTLSPPVVDQWAVLWLRD